MQSKLPEAHERIKAEAPELVGRLKSAFSFNKYLSAVVLKIGTKLKEKLVSEKISASEMPINTYKKKIIGVFVEHYFDKS